MSNEAYLANSEANNLLSEAVRRFGTGDATMRLNRLLTKLNITEVDENSDTWASSTNGPRRRGEDGAARINIGMQEVPTGVAARWGWSGDGDEQLVLKIAHETAHKFQHDEGYEQALVRALQNGRISDEDERYIPYISLYIALEESGRVSGLSTDPLYENQSQTTGLLKVEVLEDVTELIAAYLIGEEYLIYKLASSVSSLTQEQAEQIVGLVVRVCEDI